MVEIQFVVVVFRYGDLRYDDGDDSDVFAV